MSALHWICLMTLALVCCLTAYPLIDASEFNEIISYVADFTNKVEKLACLDSDAEFYTPVDVKGNYLASALNCSINELGVLVEECKLVKKSAELDNIYNNLVTSLGDFSSSRSEHKFSCENFAMKPFNEFLENIKILLQQISSESQLSRL